LGVTSIGWALIQTNEGDNEILGIGSRIIPLSPDDKNEFSSGNAISKNQKRTQKRTQRKGFDRYQLRRYYLNQKLEKHDMFPDHEFFSLSAIELFQLRDKAVKEQISLYQLGRLLLHLNQKRGYKSSRKDDNANKKETEYVAIIKGRYETIKEQGLTIGQYFYQQLLQNKYERLKEQVFPRHAYEEEYDAIMLCQSKYYPEIITQEIIDKIKNEIIYYQRPLKSQKGLVSICEFEGEWINKKNEDGILKEMFVGPKVAPRSSPLFQVCKLWETINNINIKNKKGETYLISIDQKQKLFNYLDNNKILSFNELLKQLELSKDDGWYGNKQLSKGLQGNTTKTQIANCLKDNDEFEKLLQFNLVTEEYNHTDKATGEIQLKPQISAAFEKEPLYVLWHMIYSIADKEELIKALKAKFLLPDDICQMLAKIDFTKQSFGNKSARAIRRILPYLQSGNLYSDACALAGYNHSNSLTTEQNLQRQLKSRLENLPKNSLRQPIVEKILNQLINLVNAILKEYGSIDEIRVELARELKQSKEERNNTFRNINERERKNKIIAERIENEYQLRSTKRNIDKWRLYEEADATCLYCGKTIELSDFLRGDNSDVEHIIPKARLFDDSLQNKTIAHRKCNADKGNMTAYDFMVNKKSDDELNSYLERIETLYKTNKISKSKRDKLLMPSDKIPKDFIERQLRETQYIARKAKEILSEVCYKVNATSGSVTDYLRHVWGWDEVLMNLQFDKYKNAGLTEWNDKLKREVIVGWSKRKDHRHHAIDALVIACTSQGIIQRLNNLNQVVERQFGNSIQDELKAEESLKSFVSNLKPFTTAQVENAASNILISMKAGKKVAATGTRKIKKNGKKIIIQKDIIIPRGALSEESMYGKIKVMKQVPVNELFQQLKNIVKERIKNLIEERLEKFEGNAKKAIASLKKEPIYVDEKQTTLTFGTVYKEEYVIK
jgi:CRISPR-associated endonuclease Csn1